MERRTFAAPLGCKRRAWQSRASGDCRRASRCNRRTQGMGSFERRDGRRCGRNSPGGQRCRMLARAAAPRPARRPVAAAAPTPAPTQPAADQIVEFSADQVTYDSDADIVTAERRSPHDARRQLSRRRPGRLEPQDGRGPRPGQCRRASRPRATSSSATMSCSPTRCATAPSTISWSCSKAAAGSPRSAGTRTGQVTTLENAIYSPCPVTTDERLPEATELGDHRSTGDRRSGHQTRPFRRRPAAAVRHRPSAAADLQHRDAAPTARPAGWCPTSAFRRKGLRARPALPLADRPEPRPHAHAARLHRRIAGDRSEVSRAQQHRRLPARRLPHLRQDRQRRPRPRRTTATHGTSAAISRPTASSSSIPIGASPARFGSPPTRPSRAATTSRATTGCATSSMPSGSTPNSYISIAGWAFEGLRVDDVQKQIPIALPAIDARFRLDDRSLGGKIELQANSLAIIRIEGQDTQRAFASAQWDLRRLTPWGQELTLTGLCPWRRLSHRRRRRARSSPIYRGTDGWHTRGDRRAWPLTSNGRSSDPLSAACSGWSRAFSSCSRRRRPTSTSPMRTRARSTLKTAICSRSTASPATTAGKMPRA